MNRDFHYVFVFRELWKDRFIFRETWSRPPPLPPSCQGLQKVPSNHPEQVEVHRRVFSLAPWARAQASHAGKQNLRAACLKGKLDFMFDSSPACTVPYRTIGMMATTLFLVTKVESFGQQCVQWKEGKHDLVSTFNWISKFNLIFSTLGSMGKPIIQARKQY